MNVAQAVGRALCAVGVGPATAALAQPDRLPVAALGDGAR